MLDDKNDPYVLWGYKDLTARGFVDNRSELHHLIKQRGFPAPIKTGKAVQGKARWRRCDVLAWFDSVVANQSDNNTIDSNSKPIDRPRRPRGRPRKSEEAIAS